VLILRIGPPTHVPSKTVVVLADDPAAWAAGVTAVVAVAAGGGGCTTHPPIARVDANIKIECFISFLP
jgi:hypothetical protein